MADPIKDSVVFVVFGASGDLAKKSTFPALFALYTAGALPKSTRIIGYARSKMSEEEFEEQLTSGIEESDRDAGKDDSKDGSKLKEFKKMAQYFQGKYDEDESFQKLEKEIGRVEKEDFDGSKADRVFYLALPPSSFVEVSQRLKKNNYSTDVTNRLVVEKPFGKDTKTCKEMMGKITADWKETEIYRIDHYLGEEMIRMILHLRFANAFVNPLLNKDTVESISIVMKEKFGAEGRGGYFDEFGMIRDVAQNHLLQAITLLTMEPPKSLKGDALRDAKVELLKNIPPIRNEDVLIGQYVASGDKLGYLEDESVENKESKTCTFAEFAMRINSERWGGVPVIVKCGKAMDEGVMSMTYNFKAPEPKLFDMAAPGSLTIRLNPEPSIFFKANLLKPLSMGADTIEGDLKWTVPGAKVPGDKVAYKVVIDNVLKGEHSAFVREDELEASWEIFTPLLDFLDGPNGPKPTDYKYGSAGPEGQEEFEERFAVRKGGFDM